MAVLSALLKSLQSQETAGGQDSIVSPQHSEIPLGAEHGAVECADAMTLQLPDEGPAGEQGLSDPLDIASLLPEGSSGMHSATTVVAAAPTAVAPAGPGRAPQQAGKAAPSSAAVETCSTSLPKRQKPGSFSIRAVRSRQEGGSAGMAAAASSSTSSSRSLSHIPALPAKAGPPAACGNCLNPRGSGKLTKLLAPCRRLSPHATLSSTAEAGRPSTQRHRGERGPGSSAGC